MKLFGREPTLWIQALSALLGVLVTFGIEGLSAEQAAAIVALLTAATTAVNAAMVRPVAPAAFTGVVTAGAVLLAAYGLDVSQETVGGVQVAVVAVMALLTRNQVTPKTTPAAYLKR